MQAEQQRLKATDSVVVIGGGPVGVEVAAEILTDLPGAIKTVLPSGAMLPAGALCSICVSREVQKQLLQCCTHTNQLPAAGHPCLTTVITPGNAIGVR